MPREPVSIGAAARKGAPDAPAVMIEFSDFECPFCKRFHDTVKKLVEESSGQVRWVYRHFPLEQLHPVKARQESLAAECVAELGGEEARALVGELLVRKHVRAARQVLDQECQRLPCAHVVALSACDGVDECGQRSLR